MNGISFDVVVLVAFGIMALIALFQAPRGGIRSFISLVLVAAAAVFSFLAAQPIARAIMTFDISSFGFVTLADGSVAPSLEAWMMDFLQNTEGVSDIVTASPAIESLIRQLPVAVGSIVIFMVLFLLLKPVTAILYGFFKLFVPKRDAYGRKRKKNFFAGLLFNLARAVVFLSVFLIPITGFYNVAGTTIAELEKTELAEKEDVKPLLEAGNALVKDYTESTTYGILNTVKLNGLYQSAFDKLSEIELQDGTKASFFGELNKLLPIVGDVVKLADVFGSGDLKSEDLTTIANILKDLGENDLVADILADVLKETAATILDGGESMGLSLAAMEEPASRDLLADVLGVFLDTTKDATKEDLVILGNCLSIVADAGLIESLLVEGEDVDIGAVLEIISAELENEEGTIVDALFAELEKSPRLAPLTGSLTNFGVATGVGAMGIPYDKDAVHDTMIEDVNTSLNDNNVAEINMQKVHAEIQSQAVAAASLAVRPAYQVTLLSTGAEDDYVRFMAAFLAIIDAVDNAGVEYTGEDITYTILATTYRYDVKEERWSYISVSEPAKPSVAAILAQEIVMTAQDKKQSENDKSFTVEQVTTVIAAVAVKTESAPEIKAVAEKLADKEKFETKKITFKSDIAINTAQTDPKKLASALNDVLSVAKDIIPNLPGEDEGSDDNNVLTSLLEGETLKKLGSALDKLNEVEKPSENPEEPKKNISANLLQGVIDTLPDDESSKPLKETLNQVVAGVKDPNKDVNFEDVLGGVGDASSALLGFVDYMDIENPSAEDRETAVEKLALGLSGMKGMKPEALDVLKDALLSNISDMMPEDSKELSELFETMIDKIAAYEAPAGHDFAVDAEALLELYEYISDENAEENGAHETLTDILGIVRSSDLLEVVTADIMAGLAETLLSDADDATYLGLEISKADIFSADYIANDTATSMGDRFVVALFTAVKSDDVAGDEGDTIAAFAEIMELFLDDELPGATLADAVMSAKTVGKTLPDLSDTVFAGAAAIYNAN